MVGAAVCLFLVWLVVEEKRMFVEDVVGRDG